MPSAETNAQRVIVYDTEHERAVIYDTAYTGDQEIRAIRRCVRAHGGKSNVRAMDAAQRRTLRP